MAWIETFAQRLYDGLTRLFDSHGVPARVRGLEARFGIYFGVTREVKNYQDAAGIDGELGYRFIRACFERGVYFHDRRPAICFRVYFD